MADTLQIVQWAIEQDCRLRTGEAVHDISAASSAVATASQYGRSLSKPDPRFGIFGDIFITSVTGATRPKKPLSERATKPGSSLDNLFGMPWVDYPSSGYLLTDCFTNLGGPSGLQAMCGNCPANASLPAPAGCIGHIAQRPWCGETQEHLEAIVSRLGLASVIAATFITTTPIWFGLWTNPVLSPTTAGILATLMTELMKTHGKEKSQWLSASRRDDLEAFIRAARIAESGTCRLHVRMTPPGHTDLGWHTIFPHCPLCKAEADVDRWKGKYPTELYNCKVCGTRFSPAEQASAERDDFTAEPDLREILGEQRFREFARSYLITRGMSEADAGETVALSEEAHIKRVEINRERARKSESIQRYIEKSLYAGLHIESIAGSDDPDNATAKGFRGDEFEQVILRCSERGISITGMNHESSKEDMRRHVFRFGIGGEEKHFEPLETLRKWQAEGCHELFGAHFHVPEPLIAAFEKADAAGDHS